MASSISGCSHSPVAPIRGMQMVERTADVVTFRCVRCGVDVRLARCAAIAATTGERCRSAALVGFVTCTQHHKAGSGVQRADGER